MKIIPPIAITDTNLLASNVAEDDAAAWLIAAEYDLGDRVVFAHAVYESLEAANLGNQPDQDPVRWLRLGATNRFKPFDKTISDPARRADQITYEIDHGGLSVNSLALFGLSAASVSIEVTDATDGLVYDKTIELVDNSDVIDAFTYFFAPPGAQTIEISLTDLPPYGTAKTKVTVDNLGLNAEIGQIVLGQSIDLGILLYGTSLSIQDYSRKDRDQFGNSIIVERAFSQTVDYNVKIYTKDARRVQNTLAKYRATPIVWVGSGETAYAATVYGYYQQFDIVLSAPRVSDATIEVESLI